MPTATSSLHRSARRCAPSKHPRASRATSSTPRTPGPAPPPHRRPTTRPSSRASACPSSSGRQESDSSVGCSLDRTGSRFLRSLATVRPQPSRRSRLQPERGACGFMTFLAPSTRFGSPIDGRPHGATTDDSGGPRVPATSRLCRRPARSAARSGAPDGHPSEGLPRCARPRARRGAGVRRGRRRAPRYPPCSGGRRPVAHAELRDARRAGRRGHRGPGGAARRDARGADRVGRHGPRDRRGGRRVRAQAARARAGAVRRRRRRGAP